MQNIFKFLLKNPLSAWLSQQSWFWHIGHAFYPAVRYVVQTTGMLRHQGRQPYLIGKLKDRKTKGYLRAYLLRKGYEHDKIAWIDEHEILSMRKEIGRYHQYHLRLFDDGEIRAHFEPTPEAMPYEHLFLPAINRARYFQQLLRGWIRTAPKKKEEFHRYILGSEAVTYPSHWVAEHDNDQEDHVFYDPAGVGSVRVKLERHERLKKIVHLTQHLISSLQRHAMRLHIFKSKKLVVVRTKVNDLTAATPLVHHLWYVVRPGVIFKVTYTLNKIKSAKKKALGEIANAKKIVSSLSFK